MIQPRPSCCNAIEFCNKITFCHSLLKQENVITAKEIRSKLGNGIVATESCLTAIYFGLKYKGKYIDEMLEQIFELGGDTDTIGAMAGAIWGAFNGSSALNYMMRNVEQSETIFFMAISLYAKYSGIPIRYLR